MENNDRDGPVGRKNIIMMMLDILTESLENIYT